ncbi:MAG: FAD-binding protein [Gammaproteobacteria bacterium]
MPLSKDIKKQIKTFIKENRLNIKIHNGWKNFSETINAPKALVLDIQDLHALTELQQFIYRLNQTQEPDNKFNVRVAAGGKDDRFDGSDIKHSESFSLTSCVKGDVIYRLVGSDFNQIHFDEGDEEKRLVHVGASLQVGELDNELWKLNLRTPTSTLVPYVTVGGLLANASHGTGRDQPAYAGLVESLTLLLENGKIITLDKTDPLFANLIGAHFGLFGIVLSAKLQCKPAKKIKITRIPVSFPELKTAIEQGLFDNNPYVSAMFMPTYDGIESSTRNVSIIKMKPISTMHEDLNRQSAYDRFMQSFQIGIAEAFKVFNYVKSHPGITPFYMRNLAVASQIGTEEEVSIGPWPDMHYQTAFPKNISDAHWLVPVKSSVDINSILTELQALLERAKERDEFPVHYAIYFRYFKGTNGGLSSSPHQEDEHIFAIDMVSSPGTPGYDAFKREWGHICRLKGGKPHWGKELPADFNTLDYYGEQYIQFLETYKLFYQMQGLDPENSLFINEFLRNMLRNQPLAELLPTEIAPQPLAVGVENLDHHDHAPKEGQALSKKRKVVKKAHLQEVSLFKPVATSSNATQDAMDEPVAAPSHEKAASCRCAIS